MKLEKKCPPQMGVRPTCDPHLGGDTKFSKNRHTKPFQNDQKVGPNLPFARPAFAIYRISLDGIVPPIPEVSLSNKKNNQKYVKNAIFWGENAKKKKFFKGNLFFKYAHRLFRGILRTRKHFCVQK